MNRFPNVAKAFLTLSDKPPVNTEGSVFESYTYSPGSEQISTTLPCSTINIVCPSATAITDPSEMMLSLPRLTPFSFFCPLTAKILLGIASQ